MMAREEQPPLSRACSYFSILQHPVINIRKQQNQLGLAQILQQSLAFD
jgi:hypothetical protein